jgi:aminoglycoside phosphotransferase (APT) family kinase protein
MVGDDLVHVDLTVPNVLFDARERISGVVDWNYGVALGDRWFGVVKLLHNLSFDAATGGGASRPTRQALARVETVLRSRLAPEVLRRYWAHQTLNMLYGSLRWGTERAFTAHLELGESRLS